jgi:hypothetical protein
MVVMSLSFEIQNCIDNMFKSARTGNRTILGDVANQEDRNRTVLRQQEKLMRDFPYLRNRTGRRFD